VLPRFGEHERESREKERGLRGAFAPSQKRQQYLAIIVTDQAEAVSEQIIKRLSLGVTALLGKGMYTHEERSVLMCALTVTEINNLKSVTAKVDPNAFVVITSAQSVFGKGFMPLEGNGGQ
jgi:uncharacterized membrane-anchored protein YitT (DUF2179 family)